MGSKFLQKGKLVAIAAIGALALSVLPSTAANASYTYNLGSGSCTSAAAFIRSNTTGYVAHYRNNAMLSSWNGGIFWTTRQSSMNRTWSSAKVVGQDGGTYPQANLNWAITGCGGL